MIYRRPSEPFYPELEGADTGLEGIVAVRVIRNSDAATVVARTTAGIHEVPAGSGHYIAALVAPSGGGEYTLLWDTGEPVTPATSFTEELTVTTSIPTAVASSGIDPSDIRVLIPRVRRALDGPTATSSGAVSASLTDEELTGLIADAIADVILYTGGLWGHVLLVTERDASYGAPSAWAVDPELSEAEGGVIVAQTALNYFFHRVRDLKVQETISDEGQSWSYTLSASLLTDQLKVLKAARDSALAAIDEAATDTAFVSFLETQDRGLFLALEQRTASGLGV